MIREGLKAIMAPPLPKEERINVGALAGAGGWELDAVRLTLPIYLCQTKAAGRERLYPAAAERSSGCGGTSAADVF